MNDALDMTPQGQPIDLPRRNEIHDLRNLFGIVLSAKHLLERDPGQAARAAFLEALEAAALRGDQLTTDLLATGGRDRELQATDPGDRLAGLATVMGALAEPRIEFDLEIGYPNALARIDAAEFDASIIELIANARAANARTVLIRSRKVASRLWILVCDDGNGMAPQELDRARQGIDPGFAPGTGMARVHRFVCASHGHMRVRSRPLSGTSVAIILPTLLKVAGYEPRHQFRCTRPLHDEKVREEVRPRVTA